MRRIKAIYLIPVCLVLLIGGAVASYYLLFKPRLELVDKARADWDTARQACITVAGAGDSEYKKALDQQEEFAIKIFEGYHMFRQIQNTMPEVYNMKTRFAGKEKEGVYEWYRIMGSGSMIRELNRWAKSFHLPNAPTVSYSGTMGYDLPQDAKMVSIDFGSMNFKVRGLSNLTNSLRRVTGYNYFPMIVSLPGDTATIKLNPDLPRTSPYFDPNNPSLTMSYSAKAFFLTRDWDPGSYSEADIAALEKLALDHPRKTYKPQRTGWVMAPGETSECPPVLFLIKQPGMSEAEGKYKY